MSDDFFIKDVDDVLELLEDAIVWANGNQRHLLDKYQDFSDIGYSQTDMHHCIYIHPSKKMYDELKKRWETRPIIKNRYMISPIKIILEINYTEELIGIKYTNCSFEYMPNGIFTKNQYINCIEYG